MSSWLWIWRYVLIGSCWRERSRGMMATQSLINKIRVAVIVISFVLQSCQSFSASHTSVCPCRLRLSPSPPPTKITGSRSSTSGAHSRSAHYSSHSSPAKRRRPNDTDSEASSIAGGTVARTRIAQQASASGRVTVDEVDLDGKYVRLSNKSDEVRR